MIEVTTGRKAGSRRGARNRSRTIPFLGWVTVYYAALFLVHVSLLHPWMTDLTENQLPGLVRMTAAAFLLLLYLVLACLPAMEWARRGTASSFLSRGLEAYTIFLAVSVLGWAVARASGRGVSLSPVLGLLAGSPWYFLGAPCMLVAFILFSYLGARASSLGRPRKINERLRGP